MSNNAESYLEKIQLVHSKESTLAAALVWYLSGGDPKNNVPIDDIITIFVESGLKSVVNKSRLIRALAKEPGIISGKNKGEFRCALHSLEALETKYSVDTEHSKPKMTYNFLEADTFPASRRYLVRLLEQINGTYEYEFYDGCAVLMRRLMESLLIEVFERAGEGHLIKNTNDEYLMLKGIINARGGSSIKFARGIDKTINNVKILGDNAAHGRAHLTKRNDIDDIKFEFRKLLSELKSKSGLS